MSEIITVKVKYLGIPRLMGRDEETLQLKPGFTLNEALSRIVESKGGNLAQSVEELISRYTILLKRGEKLLNLHSLKRGLNTKLEEGVTIVIMSPVSGGEINLTNP